MGKFKTNASLVLLMIMVIAGFALMARSNSECNDLCLVEPEGQPVEFTDISPHEAFTSLQNNTGNPDFVILDIRTAEEFESGYIEDAINLDYYNENFRTNLDLLDKGKTYLIYCRSANRTGKTMPIMQELGFEEVYNMSGGINDWKDQGLPVVEPE